MLDQLAFARDFITTWEDGGSTDPKRTHSLTRADNGNWTGGVCGRGDCVGSNHGVTAAALARFRGVPVAQITLPVMHALTVDEAARIALRCYYQQPGLDQLPWDAVIASVMDFGWGAGPVEGVITLQRFLGARDDGKPGPATAQAYLRRLAKDGIVAVADAWADRRAQFYRAIVTHNPTQGVFLTGWLRRSDSYRPGTPWWKRVNGIVPAAA